MYILISSLFVDPHHYIDLDIGADDTDGPLSRLYTGSLSILDSSTRAVDPALVIALWILLLSLVHICMHAVICRDQ